MDEMKQRDLKFLSEKRVQLSAPGTIVANNYYSDEQVMVDRSETTYFTGRYSSTLSNMNFGAQSQVSIPRSSLLKDTYVHFEIPDLVANQTVPRGWGYRMIDSIEYLVGSSNVSLVSLNTQSHFQHVMLQSPTSEKKSELMRLGGEEYLVAKGSTHHAYVKLALPWSSAGVGKKPLDSLLIDDPIVLSIRLPAATAIYGGTGAKPSSLLKAELITIQGEWARKEQSLAVPLQKNPMMKYNYPFVHAQSSVINFSANAGTPSTLDLLGFINGDLLSISFGLIQQNKVFDSTSAQPPCPWDYQSPKDIALTYNGQTVYQAPEEMHKIFSCRERLGAGYVQNSSIAAGTVAPFTSSAVDTYIVPMDFTQSPVHQFHNKFNNVWRVGSQTLQLTLTPQFTGTAYIYLTYYYNGVIAMNKQSQLIFD